MLWNECLCPPKIHILKPNPLCDVLGSGDFGRWLGHEGGAPMNGISTLVLEKTLGSPLDCKESQPVHPKGDQSWIFTGRTDAEVEAPAQCHLMWRAHSLGKTDAGKDAGQEDKGERGWDGWRASPTRCTWVWTNTGRQWRTGEPGML